MVHAGVGDITNMQATVAGMLHKAWESLPPQLLSGMSLNTSQPGGSADTGK